jgi:outer membrane protein OmpA-like peptidoglycan-associated protein
MRSKLTYRLLISACLPALLATLGGCANLSQPRYWGDCAIGGGVLGAFIGGGTAAGITLSENSSDGTKVGASLGAAAGGAILGAVIGHYLCDPIIQPPAPVAAQAPPPPPPSPPPQPAPQERIVLRGVHFDFNRVRIRPDAVPILDEAAGILKQHPNVNVDVNGYCDAIGNVAYNLKLSQRRANAVVSYLVDKGIAASRLAPHGYGKTNFVATNATAEGRAQNRRVELVPQE